MSKVGWLMADFFIGFAGVPFIPWSTSGGDERPPASEEAEKQRSAEQEGKGRE